MPEERFMRMAIDEAYTGINKGRGGPFGAVIIKDGEVLGSAYNTVLSDNDPTQHAEVRVISNVARKLNNYDLSGCELYTTTEPCPMCFSAIHWARIDSVIYGTDIEDVAKRGFNELLIHAVNMKEMGRSPLIVEGGFMRDECMKLLEYWDTLPQKKVY